MFFQQCVLFYSFFNVIYKFNEANVAAKLQWKLNLHKFKLKLEIIVEIEELMCILLLKSNIVVSL